MRRSKVLRSSVLLLALLTMLMLPAVTSAGAPPTQGVHMTPIGNPTWQPVDVHLFSAPIGTNASGYVEFFETQMKLLPPPNHQPHPDLGIGPGAPHQPPYDAELAAGIAKNGYREGVRFNRSEFSEGMGVWAVWMVIPHPGTTGSSPDFASGPIIPNSLFPIHVVGYAFHNGLPFSTTADFEVPALDGNLNPPFSVDGHSHFPIFLADNGDFGPPGTNLQGSYNWDVTMMDKTGNGWQITVHFAVAP